MHIDANVHQNSLERILNPCLLAISPLQDDCIKLLVEVKARIGVLELDQVSLCEMLLQAYYLLNGYTHQKVKNNQCLFCLCDMQTFHYFRLTILLLVILAVPLVTKYCCLNLMPLRLRYIGSARK